MSHLPITSRLGGRIVGLLAIILLLSATFAAGQVRFDAGAVPFRQSPTAVGVDLDWDGDLIVVLVAEGDGALPDATITVAGTLPTDALNRIVADEAVVRSEGPEVMAGGLTLVHEDVSAAELSAAYAERLEELGFSISDTDMGDFAFSMDDQTFRAAFSHTGEGGVLVYLGL